MTAPRRSGGSKKRPHPPPHSRQQQPPQQPVQQRPRCDARPAPGGHGATSVAEESQHLQQAIHEEAMRRPYAAQYRDTVRVVATVGPIFSAPLESPHAAAAAATGAAAAHPPMAFQVAPITVTAVLPREFALEIHAPSPTGPSAAAAAAATGAEGHAHSHSPHTEQPPPPVDPLVAATQQLLLRGAQEVRTTIKPLMLVQFHQQARACFGCAPDDDGHDDGGDDGAGWRYGPRRSFASHGSFDTMGGGAAAAAAAAASSADASRSASVSFTSSSPLHRDHAAVCAAAAAAAFAAASPPRSGSSVCASAPRSSPLRAPASGATAAASPPPPRSSSTASFAAAVPPPLPQPTFATLLTMLACAGQPPVAAEPPILHPATQIMSASHASNSVVEAAAPQDQAAERTGEDEDKPPLAG